MRTLRDERGQTSVEWAGMAFVVLALVLALTGVMAPLAGAIGNKVEEAACALGGGGCAAQNRDPAGGAAPGAPGAPGAPAGGSPSAAGAPGAGGPGGGGGAGAPGATGTPAASGSGDPTPAAGGGTTRGPQSGRLPNGGRRPYEPPKGSHGKPQRVRGGGFEDKYGNKWKWAQDPHGGDHWDVQHPDGSHTNVDPDGNVIGGEKNDRFPNRPPADSGQGGQQGGGGDDHTAEHVAEATGAAATLGTILWWAGKAASPACGPFAPVCAVVF